MARIEPVRVKHWAPEYHAALRTLAPDDARHPQSRTEGRPKALNILGTIAHHPGLAKGWFPFNAHVTRNTTLDQRQRELLVLRTAVLRDSEYEFEQHVFVGRDVGITDEEFERVKAGPDAPGWGELDELLVRSVDELVVGGAITRPTWDGLMRHFDAQQVLDVIFTVGAYEILAWMIASFEVPIDDDIYELSGRVPPGRQEQPPPPAAG